MSPRMNTGERQALRQVVRQRMKVLRADVAARKAELQADVEAQITERYAQRDKLVADLNQVVENIWDQARKDARAAMERVQADHPEVTLTATPTGYTVGNADRHHLRRRLLTEIESQVAAALVDIDRREADLIEELTVDGLETDAAKDFLGRIPTVGQLVPTARLHQLTTGEQP